MQEKSSLSFIQLVIIVAVLGVIARTVGPAFTRAGTERAVGGLIDGLETMRTALDLYRAHHGGKLPPCESFEKFAAAMTTETGRYRPPLKHIPVNPFNGLDTVRFDGEPAGSGRAGWRFDTNSGCFRADNDANYSDL